MSQLNGKKILMFVDHTYEDLELWYPKLRLIEAGAEVDVAGPKKAETYISKHGYPCIAEISIDEAEETEYDGLVIPGGFAPDKLRRIDKVRELTRQFQDSGKLVAHICHGGWIPISAGIMNGFHCTSTPAIKDDLMNAGAEWTDAEVVVDRNQISSRRPGDLPQFCREIIRFLEG